MAGQELIAQNAFNTDFVIQTLYMAYNQHWKNRVLSNSDVCFKVFIVGNPIQTELQI